MAEPASMDLQPPVLHAENVQLPSLTPLVLNRILQYVYSSERSSALRCRLVSHSFDDLMVNNVRLNLNYKATLEPNRCQLSLSTGQTGTPIFPTDQLINSRLVQRVFSMKVSKDNDGDWDQQDLIRLGSELSRPVDVRMFADWNLPIWPLAETPQMRVVEVFKEPNSDMSPPELDFIADLATRPQLNRLVLTRGDLLQLNQRVDQLRVSMLVIAENFNNQRGEVPTVDVTFFHSLTHLRDLAMCIDLPVDFSFRGVTLPHLVVLCLDLVIAEFDNHSWLLSSMNSAMPQLKQLRYSFTPEDNIDVIDLIVEIIRFCPSTVEHFHFNVRMSFWIFRFLHRRTRPLWENYWKTIFTAILDSHLTRVTFDNCVKPTWYDEEAKPFEYEESSSGAQLGLPETPCEHVHRYKLEKKRNGQICTLDITCDDRLTRTR